MVATKLNTVQLQLLQLFARQMAENELAEVKAMLVAYYDRKITEEADQLWEQKGMTANTMNDLLNTHIRSPYNPQLGRFYSPTLAENVLKLLINIPKIEKVDLYFNWNLISNDADDNKFVDCAIACGADYIVTHDKHFRVLKDIPFPKVNCLSIDELKEIL